MDHLSATPKILVAPLDWGLGHATRCIPIIKQLIASNCKVILAGDGKAKALLQKEFGQLTFLHLPGYKIKYATTSWGLPFKIVAQIPSIISAINKEQQWLKKVVEEQKIDAVISDNRFGLYHNKVTSVFISHQLKIKAPLAALEDLLQRLNYHFINRFTTCWVPDSEGSDNLAGELSHPSRKPSIPLHYIGHLSRFTKGTGKGQTHLLIILSGPEPQRTILEKMLAEDLKSYHGPVIFVRGLPEATEPIILPENVSVYNHLPSAELEEKIRQASFVISRCGYSTIMDLAVTQKKSILIPTPGQTEQEYLAAQLMKRNFALCVKQEGFRLKTALDLAAVYPYRCQKLKNNLYYPLPLRSL